MGTVEYLGDGIFVATATDVNWTILREGSDLTLIDAGYPGDADYVEESIRSIGHRPEDVRAILLTHTHIDHVGAVNRFHRRYRTPAFASDTEIRSCGSRNAPSPSPVSIAANSWRRGVPRWSLSAVSAGGMRNVALSHLEKFPEESGPMDLPGRPAAMRLEGHTAGHSAFKIAGGVVTGDAVICGHPISRLSGPQLLPSLFHHSTSQAVSALETLATCDTDLLIPGHGSPWRGPIEHAVTIARANLAEARSW